MASSYRQLPRDREIDLNGVISLKDGSACLIECAFVEVVERPVRQQAELGRRHLEVGPSPLGPLDQTSQKRRVSRRHPVGSRFRWSRGANSLAGVIGKDDVENRG